MMGTNFHRGKYVVYDDERGQIGVGPQMGYGPVTFQESTYANTGSSGSGGDGGGEGEEGEVKDTWYYVKYVSIHVGGIALVIGFLMLPFIPLLCPAKAVDRTPKNNNLTEDDDYEELMDSFLIVSI
jgi:hypothetical protein